MKEYYINCLCDYLIALERLKNRYFVHGNPSAVSNLYRGLPDKDYKLLPSLFRKQTDWCNYEEDNPEYITNNAYLEYGTEVGILQAFIHEASRFVDLPSDELEKWAEYAQHYGAPTRLLDWTSNPLVALYFACKYVPKDDKKSKTKISDKTFGKDGKVWMLHVKNYDHKRYG